MDYKKIKTVFDKPYYASHTFIYIEDIQVFTNRIYLSDIEDEIKLVPYALFEEFMSLRNNCASDSIFGYLHQDDGFLPGDDLPIYTDRGDVLRWFRSFDDDDFREDIFTYPLDRDEIYCQLMIEEDELIKDAKEKLIALIDDPNIEVEYPFIDKNSQKHFGFAKFFTRNGATLIDPEGSALKEGVERLPTSTQYSSILKIGHIEEKDYEEFERKKSVEVIPDPYIPKRAVNAYIASNLSAFRSEIDLLIWAYSLIKNKKLGFKTILYIDELGKQLLEEKEIILPLYDEVNLINTEDYKDINLNDFWAVAKFHAMKEELKNHGTDFFIMDVDFSFIDDTILSVFKENPVVFWDNREEFYWVYPEINRLSIPENFKYPRYIKPEICPINSAIIRCTSKEVLAEWVDIFFKFITGNPVEFKDDFTEEDELHFKGLATWICTAEQRFLGCILSWYNIKPYFFRNEDKSFLSSHFHTWIFKNSYNNTPRLLQSWLAALIAMIYMEDENRYNIICNSLEKFPILKLVIENFEKTHFPPALKQYINQYITNNNSI